MHQNWVKVYSNPDKLRSEIVRQTLEDFNLEAVLLNKMFYDHFGEQEIYVKRENVIPALKIIQDEIKFE